MKTPHSAELPAEIESYLPPDLWRKLSSGEPQRRLLIQALDRLRSLVYLLSTFIPSNIVQEKMIKPVPGFVSGEMLEGSLLFADVSGFTALSERLAVLGPEGAERLTTTMNDYFEAMLAIVASSGGILLKFAGDAMLVYFPAQENNQQAQWAVRAGIRMMQAIDEFTSIETPTETTSLQMKIGVSTGAFLSASIGSIKRMEYAILGNAVSQTMASESAATGPGQLVICQNTADCLDTAFHLKEGTLGFHMVEFSEDAAIDDFEIKAERRRARGSIAMDASPEALVAQMEEMLAQILALKPYIASELVERIIAHVQKRKVESEFLTAAVLFCNFVGPDPLLEVWGEDGISRVTNLLSDYFSAMSNVITRYGGIITRIDPYSKGTKLLALFGAPVSHQDDPLRAVRAALMMNVELDLLNERWHKRIAHHLPSDFDESLIQHRIGITVGETFAGQVGSANRREYTVMGDDVNLSARLMGAAEMGQILISQPIFQAVDDFFFLSELTPIRVKGKSKPISIYQVDGPRTETLLNRVRQRGNLVGRDDDLAQGEGLLTRVLDGECASLTIQGSAGIGKSHLADMLLQKAISKGAEVLSYQCNSYNADISYTCWSGILRSLAGITSTDPVLLYKAKLGRLIEDLGIPKQHVPHLARLVGLTANDLLEVIRKPQSDVMSESEEDVFMDIISGQRVRKQGRGLDLLSQLEEGGIFETSQMGFQIPSKLTHKEQELLLDAICSLLTQVLSNSPLVLFFEDAHWMDEATRKMLPALQKRLLSTRLLILLSQREGEDQPPIGATLTLAPLDAEGTSQLVADALVSDLGKIIHQQSQGNPLFIGEILAWVQQTWQISTAEVVNALQSSDILQKLVLSNLKNLPESQREIARVGSVVGENFRVGEIQALLPSSVDTVTMHNDLRGLVEAGFISLSEAGIDPRYAYQQKLVRDILYNSMPFARRRELHAQLAEYLISPTSQRSELHEKIGAFLNASTTSNPLQDAKIVAFHYEAAENWAQAAKSLQNVANQLMEADAHSEATKTYDRALACLKNMPSAEINSESHTLQRILRVGQADSALLCRDYSHAVSAYEAALALEDESFEGLAKLRMKIALVQPMVGMAAEAESTLREFLLEEGETPNDLAASATLTWLLWRAGAPDVTEWIEKSRDVLPPKPDSWAMDIEALLDDLSGQWHDAITKYHAINRPTGTALASVRLGDQVLRDGDNPGALELYEEAFRIFSELPNSERGLALVHYRLAELSWQKKDIDASRSHFNEIETLLDSCPTSIRDEGRILVLNALEITNCGKNDVWPNWRWMYLDDNFKIGLLFRE